MGLIFTTELRTLTNEIMSKNISGAKWMLFHQSSSSLLFTDFIATPQILCLALVIFCTKKVNIYDGIEKWYP